MRKNFLPKKTKREIIEILKKRKFENLQAIEAIENFFIKKRGYIFKMPKPQTPVILLLSGGLDSIIAWTLLMDIYQLKVYPLVRIAQESGLDYKKAKKIIKIFSLIFEKKYPKLFREPFFFKENLAISEIEKEYTQSLKNNKENLFGLIINSGTFVKEIPDVMSSFISQSLQYQNLLKIQKKEKINTIFFGLISSDGEAVRAQTFTSLRSMMFHACNTTQDYHLQISSLAIEKELGYFLSAKELIQANKYLNLPLELTWSCQKKGSRYHCGECYNCGNRRYKFSISGVKDRTIYLSDYQSSYLKFLYKKYFQPHFPLLHKLFKYVYNKIIQ